MIIGLTVLIIVGIWGSILLVGEVLKENERNKMECWITLDAVCGDVEEENEEREEN